MKKITTAFLTLFSLFCLSVSFAAGVEAAKVAIVPLQVNEKQVGRAGDFNSYYWDVIINKLEYPDFELLDEDVVAKVVPEDGLQSFDKASLIQVAAQTGADIVIAMRLDKVSDRSLNQRRGRILECRMQGEYASYNGVTGKYYAKKIHYSDEMEEVLTRRTDWQQRAFVTNLRRYLGRTIAVK